MRGTTWLVQDTCTTTLTRVTQGVVAVNDFAKRKTVLVKKGKRYTARAKKRALELGDALFGRGGLGVEAARDAAGAVGEAAGLDAEADRAGHRLRLLGA